MGLGFRSGSGDSGGSGFRRCIGRCQEGCEFCGGAGALTCGFLSLGSQ